MKRIYTFFLMILGIALIGMGSYLMLNPDASLRAFTLTIAIFLILNGVNELFSYYQMKKYWSITKWSLLEGLFSLIVGIFTLVSPNIAEKLLVIVFAVWILISAILHIVIAFSIRPITGWFMLMFMGIVTAALAVGSFFTTAIAAVTVAVMLGLFFISLGFTWITLAWLSFKYYKLRN